MGGYELVYRGEVFARHSTREACMIEAIEAKLVLQSRYGCTLATGAEIRPQVRLPAAEKSERRGE